MLPELKQGMSKMKFALNHQWKFKLPVLAFFVGLAQVLVVVMVSIISYFIIINTDDIIDIVKDFLVIKVVSELDDYFFKEHIDKQEISKQIISEEAFQGIVRVE